MVDSKRYNPSNKRFQKHTQHFVENTTMKGHLVDDEKKKKSKYKVTGELAKINKNGIYSNGWYVKVNKKILQCNYGDNIVYLPPYTEKGEWFVPTHKCEVEVSVDEKSKINTITKMNDPKKKPIAMDSNGVKIEGSGTASVKVSKSEVTVSGELKVDTTDEKDLPDEIKITDMYREIQELKEKVSDNDVNGE